MAYIMIEDYSCVWPTGVTPLDPQGFAIHWWGSGTPQFMPIVNLLVNRAAQGSASIHFVAEEGLVACLTSPFEVAWGQGDGANGWGNRNLVSIECNPRCSAGDRETVAELIADQHIKNGIPINLYPHNKFTATMCPGVWEQWIPWLTNRANEIVAEKTKGTFGKEEEMASAEDIAKAVWAYNNGSDRDAYQHLRDGSKLTNLYGTELTSGEQLAWIDKNLNDARDMILSAITGAKVSVELNPEQINQLAESLKNSLGAGVAADLAKRLAE